MRELVRQRGSLLYQRVGLSTERDAVLTLAEVGRIDERPRALIRDPYVLEFLGLSAGPAVDESTLEQSLIDNLQHFLLELGSEFCFVDRQYNHQNGCLSLVACRLADLGRISDRPDKLQA